MEGFRGKGGSHGGGAAGVVTHGSRWNIQPQFHEGFDTLELGAQCTHHTLLSTLHTLLSTHHGGSEADCGDCEADVAEGRAGCDEAAHR